MKVNPINTINSATTFKANIQPTQSLRDGFSKIEKCINSGTTKDLDYAKDFIDSIARISESKKIDEFKIEIDKRRPDHTYTKINGRRVSGGHNERQTNLLDDYLVVEGTKKYASKLEEAEPSLLDSLKAELDEAKRVLNDIETRYTNRLKVELEQAQKMIFKNDK